MPWSVDPEFRFPEKKNKTPPDLMKVQVFAGGREKLVVREVSLPPEKQAQHKEHSGRHPTAKSPCPPHPTLQGPSTPACPTGPQAFAPQEEPQAFHCPTGPPRHALAPTAPQAFGSPHPTVNIRKY